MDELIDFLNTTAISFGESHQLTVLQLIMVVVLAVFGFAFARWSERRISRGLISRDISADAVQLIRRSFYIIVVIVLCVTTLELLNVPLTAFAFLSGAIAIGVGFGAQNIINNFISGWILIWERPIRIGDFLEVGDMKGRVETINTRYTRMQRVDGVRLLIPNSQLLENMVVNWTIVDRLMRTSVRVGVQYGSDVRRVKELLEQIAAKDTNIEADPEPLVIFEDFGDSALIFDVYFWVEVGGERDLRVVRSNFRFEIDRLFAENGIVIAFPQRDVHVDGLLRIANESIHANSDTKSDTTSSPPAQP